ncbi:MAG: FAD-dependent oxidoreductase [Hyphomicrobium sp.]|jgi:pyruvate/2-oxoglutarate dehydrogenase complex dihydrolipoamide dehydrogenase (E3) component
MEMGKSINQPGPQLGADADSENIVADICVLGGDAAGLAVATAAVAFGRSVVLIDRHQLGGEALRHGPLAERALGAVARRAQALRTASLFGISGREPEIELRAINEHVQEIIREMEPNFAPERFAGLGVRVIHGAGRFINKRTVVAGDRKIRARRFVIATGSTPAIPVIPGLDNVPYFTAETIFTNEERLHNLIVIGGGAQALELAQTCCRLGSRVIVLEAGKVLADQDPELSKFVVERLASEGIAVHENTKVDSVEGGLGRVRVNVTVGEDKHTVEGSHLLVAVGRKPATSDLGLEVAGIRYDERGIKVNGGLKTTNRRVFAVGQVAAGLPATQGADYFAGIVIRRALLHTRARVDARQIPAVVFTDPELAYVGLSEAEALKTGKKIHVLRWPYRESARAEAERVTTGHIKVVTGRDGRILGAGIVGALAGELIGMWALAISQGLSIKAMSEWVAPYPTFSEINKNVAASYYAATPTSPTLRKVIDFLAKLG